MDFKGFQWIPEDVYPNWTGLCRYRDPKWVADNLRQEIVGNRVVGYVKQTETHFFFRICMVSINAPYVDKTLYWVFDYIECNQFIQHFHRNSEEVSWQKNGF